MDDNDVRVTGPNGFDQFATFVGVTPAGNGPVRTATYRLTAPGGTFDDIDYGTYAVSLPAGRVANTAGATMSAPRPAVLTV